MATSYSNIGGTGNRAHLIATSFSGISGGAGSAYVVRMLDGIKTAGGVQSAWAGGLTAVVMKFDFGANRTKIIDEFTWYQDVVADNGIYSFAGSNDDISYTDLATGFHLGSAAATTVVAFTNTTAYRYYKLYQTGGTTSATPWNEEIEFKLQPGNSALPSYDNTGGRGNRSAIITTSNSGFSGGCGSNFSAPLVDGSLVNGCSTAAAWGGAVTAGVLTFDFGVGASWVINAFSWFQDVDATHGTWKFSGSNDNISYTDIATGLTLGCTSATGPGLNRSTEYTFTNVTGYRYYRLTQTGGTTSAASWDREIEFQIGAGSSNADAAQTIPAFTQTATFYGGLNVAAAQTAAVFSQVFTGGYTPAHAVSSQNINDFPVVQLPQGNIVHLAPGGNRLEWGVLPAGARPRRVR